MLKICIQKLGNFTMHAQAAKAISEIIEARAALFLRFREPDSIRACVISTTRRIYDAITVFLSSLCKINLFAVFRSQMVAKTSRQRNIAILHLGILASQAN
jgi:hypothetical protein